MSHNMTGYVPSNQHKKRIGALHSNAPATILKNLESLGLMGSTDALQKDVANGNAKMLGELIASGAMRLSASGSKKAFYEYEIDQALLNVDAKPAERITFKLNLERAGMMVPNPR
jgi:hypothetical protein